MILFDEKTHTYTDDGKHLISVTQLMKKHGLAPDYSGVTPETLMAKAERGTLIHKEIETWIKTGEIGFTEECVKFAQYAAAKNLTFDGSEVMAFNDICAGTIDLLLNGDTIADIKTTSTIHTDAVSWQLSIYAALLGKELTKAQVFHFAPDGTLNVVDIQFKPKEEVERLFACEREGTFYAQDLDVFSPEDVSAVDRAQRLFDYLEAQKTEAEEKLKEAKSKILAEMEKRGLKSCDLGKIKFTLVPASERKSIDTARLKKEQPDIAAAYEKTSAVAASLRITVR